MNRMADTFARPKGLVVEIGSNDGTALRSLADRDVRILGVDPSRNLSALATASGVPTIDEFFTEELAKGIVETQGQADLIVGCNVLGHIDDLDDVCRGIKVLLGDHGAFVLEVPYLGEMLDQLEWDTIYHEHLSLLTVAPLRHLFRRFGLGLQEVEFVSVHGGSIRCTVVQGEVRAPSVDDLIEAETAKRLADRRTYALLPDQVRRSPTRPALVAGAARQRRAESHRLRSAGERKRAAQLLRDRPRIAPQWSSTRRLPNKGSTCPAPISPSSLPALWMK